MALLRDFYGKNWAQARSMFYFSFISWCLGIAIMMLSIVAPVTAATLNVEFDVRTRAADNATLHQRKNVAIFVLDRSGSMRWKPEKVERLANGDKAENRNQLLVESFQERVLAISANDPSTIVYLIPFSGGKGTNSLPYSLKTKSDVDKLLGWEGLRLYRCTGGTYLYDTLAYAISFAERLSDPSVRLSLYVYTDGENETSRDAIYRSEKKKDIWGNIDNASYERQLAEAKALFEKEHGWKIGAYASNGKMETYWRWLGKGEPPGDSLMKTKDEYKISFAAENSLLKNPVAASEQKLSVSVGVPLPEKYFKDLDKATLTLQLAGRNVGRKMVSLKPGSKLVSFQFDDNISSDTFAGTLSLSDLPEWDRVVLSPPAPLELTFAAPGKLSFLDIEPKGECFVKKGSTKEFKAKATEGADIHWSWPGGSKTINVCPITFTTTAPDFFDVLVTAKKRGFLPVEEKIKVHVIDADVGVNVVTPRPMVGESIEFQARAHGQPESFSWKIDNQTMSGQGASLKVPVFGSGSGKHVVNVRAYYGHGIIADSGDVPFVVAAKPYVEIIEPDSGNEYPFGEKIECKANVEGDFDRVVWELEGPAGEKQESAVDKSTKASRPVSFKPAKGGTYTLKATAVGAVGSLPANASVVLKVAYENLGINITSHASGTPVQLGRNVENLNLLAEVTGDKITKVKWFVRSESGGGREIRTTPVLLENGKRVAKCSFSPDPSTKDGLSLFVRAEAIFDDGAPSDPVVSPAIELIATRYAAIEVEAKVNGNEANGRDVRFGDQVELHAKCEGDIDTGKVQWYKSVDGVITNTKSVRGAHCTSPKEVPNKSLSDGDNLRTVHYFAVAGLSDGSAVTSRAVIVHHYCPDVKFAINLPSGEDGLPCRSFRPGDVVHLCLPESEQPLADVKWDFGDGTTATGYNVEHSYSDEKSHKITAKGRCAKCGKLFSTAVEVSTKCPDLELAVVLKGEERFAKKYGLKKPVNVELSVKNGEATEVTWDFGDGGTTKGMEASHSYEKYGTYTITASAKCKRCGKHFTASSEKIEVTVIPPQAVLEIEQKGSHYGTGDKITLSAAQSEGDIVDCIWEMNGKGLTEHRGKQRIVVTLPDRPCEMVAKVTLIGPEGTEPSEAQREIRVRYGAKVMALLIVLVVFMVCVLAWLLLNNGPAGWMFKIYCCEAIDHSTEENQQREKNKVNDESLPVLSIDDYWNFMNKKATISFEKVLSKDKKAKDDELLLDEQTEEFLRHRVEECKKTAGIIVNPIPDVINEESLIELREEMGYDPVIEPYEPDDAEKFEYWLKGSDHKGPDYRQYKGYGDTAKKPQVLRFVLDRSRKADKYTIYFVLLTSCVIAAAFWAALKFAI